VRLVCLEVVNNAVQVQNLDQNSVVFLKTTLLDYVRRTYGSGSQEAPDQPSLQNKLAQTMTYLFVHLYASGWETFIDDFLALTSSPNSGCMDNVPGVVLYLRMLNSVHDEIADVFLSRQSTDSKRNTDLKDLVRERDMPKVARSFQDLLSTYSGQNDNIIEHTLKAIKNWVSWIDISLIINQDMLNLLFPLVGRTNSSGKVDTVRDEAINTFTEIVGKKMKRADKMELISFLNLREIISQLIASPPLHEFQKTPRYDTDLGEAVAKLVNNVMQDIVKALEDSQSDNETRVKAERHLIDFLPLLLRFFSDEYDEICSTVIPSLTDLLTLLRKIENLPPSYVEMLRPILNAVILKMRYDETSTWGDQDEQTDEAEFEELRKRLEHLQKSIAAINQPLYVEVLTSVIATAFQTLDERGSQMDWRDLDVALHELYLFGELALPNQGLNAKNQPSPEVAETLVVMMRKMVDSGMLSQLKEYRVWHGSPTNCSLAGVAEFPHPAILLQYLLICNRFTAFFESNTEYIPRVMENYVRIVHHTHPRIRLRSWYQFFRFVKQLRGHVGQMAEMVIQSIRDLLPIKAEVPKDDAEEDMSSDETDTSEEAVFTSQLYLFEAIGAVSSTNATPVEKQVLYVRSVMEPLYVDLEQHLPRAKSGDAQATLQIQHIIQAMGALAHGFTDHQLGASNSGPPPAQAVSEEFSRTAEAILIALADLNGNREIRAACRGAFSKLLTVLGTAVLPQLPQWIDGLLSKSSKDEMAFFLRLLDQIVFGFKAQIYDVLNILLQPLLRRVFEGLAEDITGTDDEIQLAELRREFLQFLQIIINNDLQGVLISGTNQGFFDTIIGSVITLGRIIDHSNLVASRLAITLLSRMTGVWGGPDVANISANPSAPSGSPNPTIPGFDQFVLDSFHSLCWEIIQEPTFRPGKDAQSRQVLVEIAALEQAIYVKTGDLLIQRLQSTIFPTFGIDGQEFLRSMTTSTDKKTFANYLLRLVKDRR